MKKEFDLPANSPAWLVWLVGRTEGATKVRMAISMLVVLVSSVVFVGLVSFKADQAVRAVYAGKCPFEAAGWTCSLPTNPNDGTAICVRNASALNPMGGLAVRPSPGATP